VAGTFKNAQKNSDRQNARNEHETALARMMTAIAADDTERLNKQFSDTPVSRSGSPISSLR